MATRRSVYAAVVVLCASFTLMMAWAQTALAVEAPVVEDESVLDVSATSATVQATINPKGSVTSYRFEYGTSNSYGATAPQTEGEIAAGTQGEDVSVHIQSLDPATTYHYRVVATGPGGSANGSDLTFTTQATGGELVLPDNRQWELVSPPNKHGALIEPGREEGGAIQAASAGSAIAYYASAPVTGEEVGSRSPEPSQILSQRGANGWTTKDLAPPNNEANQVAVGFGTDYRAFSSDLSLGLLEPLQNLPLSSEATEWTPYLREDETEDYRPLVTTASNVLPGGTKFGRYGSRYGNAQIRSGQSRSASPGDQLGGALDRGRCGRRALRVVRRLAATDQCATGIWKKHLHPVIPLGSMSETARATFTQSRTTVRAWSSLGTRTCIYATRRSARPCNWMSAVAPVTQNSGRQTPKVRRSSSPTVLN